MSPSFARLDSANCVVPNPIFSGNNSLQSIILTYGSDLFKRQFSIAALFTTICSAVSNSIRLVAYWRIPSKIAQMIVLWVSIVMTALHALWSNTYKSLHNQFMRSANLLFVVFPQTKVRSIVIILNRLFFNFASFYRSNTTKIRNLVNTLKSNNIKPLFHHNPRLLSMGIL